MIHIQALNKSFGSNRILNDVNLSCETGKIQALLGANGAGKSTLIYTLSGLLKRDSGEIYIDGELIDVHRYKYKSKIGYVFEVPLYFDKLTASEFLIFSAKMREMEEKDYLPKVKHFMNLLEIPDDKKFIGKYSKGMKQKINIITALLHNPKYLILDEPFANLDFLSIQRLTKVFKDLASSGVTILIASHQFDVIMDLCDNFSLLKDGKIYFNYSMEELKAIADKKHLNADNSVKLYLQNLMEE